MSITVYWSFLADEWMRVAPPSPVRKSLYEKRIHEETDLMMFHRCPFLHSHLENIYELHSPYEYSFKVEGQSIVSSFYNKNFFDKHIIIRSIEKKAFSFLMPYIFFTEENSLEVSLPSFPYLEDNNISQRCIPFVGTIDIGKYFRPMDFGFLLKDTYDEFIINNNEIFGYADFKTKEKIIFKQFYPTEKIYSFIKNVSNTKNNRMLSFFSPENYYNNFKLKKLVLKEIKDNLVD